MKVFKSPKFATGVAECFAFGSKIEVDEIFFTTGGSAVNTAIAFRRQGLRSAAIAKIGTDLSSEGIIQTLKKESVHTGFIARDPKHLTAYSIVLLAPSGERTILVYRGASEELAIRDIPQEKLKTEWFYIGHLAGKSRNLFLPLIEFARAHRIKIALNPGSTQLKMSERWWRQTLRYIDILILNREEASLMTRVPFENEQGIFKKLDGWVRGIVVMTEGPLGVWVSDGEYRWRAGILKERDVIDRTGAGDAFAAGFVTAFIQKKVPCEKGVCFPHERDMEYAIQLGSANATSQIEKLGARDGLLRKNESIYKWGKLTIEKRKLTS